MLVIRLKKGFTLIELVVVILLISILSVLVLPKLNLDDFRESGFAQQSMGAIRFAQKQAIGSGCEINVRIAADECTVKWNGTPAGIGCLGSGVDISNPATGLNDFCNNSTPKSIGDLPTEIRFNNIGQPALIDGDNLSINLTSRIITVEPETGFVHE